MSRYVYLLGTMPPSIIEKAHESAFRQLPVEKRREMFDELRPFMTEQEREHEPDAGFMASVLRRISVDGRAGTAVLEERREHAEHGARGSEGDARNGTAAASVLPADLTTVHTLVAMYFLSSATVSAYFSFGAGSVGIEGEPAWVGDLTSSGYSGADGFVGSSGADAGGYIGFDGGGFSGGFDGGGGSFG